MPSVNRLLVLVVIGVSLCVQAAPVPDGADLDVCLCSTMPRVRLMLTGSADFECRQAQPNGY